MMRLIAAALVLLSFVSVQAFAPTCATTQHTWRGVAKFGSIARGPNLRVGTARTMTMSEQTETSPASKLKLFRMLDEAAEMIAEAVALKPAALPEEAGTQTEVAHEKVALRGADETVSEAEQDAQVMAGASISRLDQILQDRHNADSESLSLSSSEAQPRADAEAQAEALEKAGDIARATVAEVVAQGIPLSVFDSFDPKVRQMLAQADTDGNHVLDAKEIVKAFEACFQAVDASTLSDMSTRSSEATQRSVEALSGTAEKLAHAERAAREAVALSLTDQIVSEGTTYKAATEADPDEPDLFTWEEADSLAKAEEAARDAVAANLEEQIVSEGKTYAAKRDEDDGAMPEELVREAGLEGAPGRKDPALEKAEEAARLAVAAALGEIA